MEERKDQIAKESKTKQIKEIYIYMGERLSKMADKKETEQERKKKNESEGVKRRREKERENGK